MSGTKRNVFGVLGFAEMMILILTLLVNSLVISTTPESNVTTEVNGLFTAHACDLTISCKENESIHIVYANFGRLRADIWERRSYNELNCSANDSLSIVLRLCSGKSNCTVPARKRIFYDPCYGITKYLTMTYQCQSATTEANGSFIAYAWERTELTISCKANESIHIVYANYGRLSGDICKHLPYHNLNCSANDSLSIVRHRCSGKSNCNVRASNIIFGDPCPHKSKYLKVTYQCPSGNMTAPPADETHGDTDLVTSSRNRETPTPPYNGLFCLAEKKRKVIWTATRPDSIATLPCPNNIDLTKAKRICGNKAEWGHVIDLSECVSKEIVELQDKLDSLTRNFSLILVRELMDGLEEKVSTGDDLYGGDLEPLAKIMVAAVNLTQSKGVMNVSDVDRILESVVNTTSMLLQPKNIDAWMDLPRTKQSSTATRLLWSVESSSAFRANSISETKNFKVKAPGLDVIVDDLMQKNFSASFNWVGTHDTVDYLKPRVPEAGNGLGRVTVALFDGVGQWLHVNESATKYPHLNATSSAVNDSLSQDTPEVTPVLVVNTRVMSISIVSRSGIDAEKVSYILEHKEKRNSDSDPVCVFWKYSKETFEGHWSDEGCRDVTNCSYCTYTVCECDHLTNFAVLMSVSSHQNLMSLGNAFALSVITYLGCIISIVCLALAFITFYWFKDLQCVRNTIHKNLVLCLFISEVIFLLGIVQYEHKELCAAVTGFLHYFFLASFSWMFLEGIQLYVLLIEVFEARTFRLRWYYLNGYGVPALIVLISAVTAYAQGNRYAAEDYCWLSKEGGLIWAFTGPVAVITCVNSVVLGVAIYTIHTSKASSQRLEQKSKIDTIGSWVRAAVVLMVLLGSTWVFGFFYVNKESLFIAYIFTILNSLQGLFIFVFHCLTCEKVQKEYRRCIQRCTWLPEYVRVKFGGLSVTPLPSQNHPTGSLGISSSDCLYDHDKSMDLDAIHTQVDEKEFNGPNLVEICTSEESFFTTDHTIVTAF